MLLRNIVQGETVLSSTSYLSLLCTQSWHMQMSYICIRGLANLSKWGGFFCSEKSEVCEHCANGKNMKVLLLVILSCYKQVVEDEDLSV